MHENFSGLKVMVIDDSNTIRRAADSLLSEKGCNLITATDGHDALAKIVAKKPAIIFIDTIMPGIDGYQICAFIKNNKELEDTPVIMLSRNAGLFDRAKGRIFGADEFLKKPFSKDQLYCVIQYRLVIRISQRMLRPFVSPPRDATIKSYREVHGEVKLRKICRLYRHYLTRILKNGTEPANFATFYKLFKLMVKLCGDSPMGQLSAMGMKFIECIATERAKIDSAAMSIFLSIGNEIERLVEQGVSGLAKPIERTLVLSIAQAVTEAYKGAERAEVVRNQYVDDLSTISNSVAEPDPEAIKAVSIILIKELNIVIDKLNLCIQSVRYTPAEVVSLMPQLEKICNIMFLVGDLESEKAIDELLEIILKIQSGNEPYQDGVIRISRSLLKVKNSLEILDGISGGELNFYRNLKDSQAVLIRETRLRIAACKKVVLFYMEAEFDHDILTPLSHELAVLINNLIKLEQRRAADIIVAADEYIRLRLLRDTSQCEANKLENFADALTSVDYFLLRLLKNADYSSSRLLEIGEAAIKKLWLGIDYQIEKSTKIEVPDEQISQKVEDYNSEGALGERRDVSIEGPLYTEDFFAEKEAELLEEIALTDAITEADGAIAKLERVTRPFNEKSHPSSDE